MNTEIARLKLKTWWSYATEEDIQDLLDRTNYEFYKNITMTNNSILTIQPYRNGNVWVFDDDQVGLVREPFVGSMNDIIDDMVKDLTRPELGFQAMFSDQSFPGSVFVLNKIGARDFGTDYRAAWLGIEGWLCPALFKYFTEAPDRLFIQVLSLEKPSFWRRLWRACTFG